MTALSWLPLARDGDAAQSMRRRNPPARVLSVRQRRIAIWGVTHLRVPSSRFSSTFTTLSSPCGCGCPVLTVGMRRSVGFLCRHSSIDRVLALDETRSYAGMPTQSGAGIESAATILAYGQLGSFLAGSSLPLPLPFGGIVPNLTQNEISLPSPSLRMRAPSVAHLLARRGRARLSQTTRPRHRLVPTCSARYWFAKCEGGRHGGRDPAPLLLEKRFFF